MIEQLYLEDMKSDEEKAFDLIYPEIKSVILDAPLESQIIFFKELDNYSSIYFLDENELFFCIRLRKKAKYILIPETYEDLIPETAQTSKVKSSIGMVRIQINDYTEIIQYAPLLRKVLARLCKKHREFGCCSRYEACSNEKHCIHPDPEFAIKCWYRDNMQEGRIFYGKNKNIN